MRFFPLFADLQRRPCLVVGGGRVAERRVRLLLRAGAVVTVLAPRLSRGLQELAACGKVRILEREFGGESLDDYWLVVAATGDPEINARVHWTAESARRLCNVVDDPAHCSFIMPAIIDRHPLMIAIGSGGSSPVLSRWVKGVIESSLPGRLGALADLMGRWRGRVRESLASPEQRRRFWERVVTGTIAEACFAGKGHDADDALARELGAWVTSSPSDQHGEAYLVGAGPGAADLITLRGHQLLSTADVVLYDRLVDPAVLEYARKDAQLISVGKTPGRPSITQKQLNRLLVRLVAGGKRVCRLKGGDPMVFGRGGEELEALRAAGLPFQVVPGVSAAEGCAAYAGIPLTLRGIARKVLLTTGKTHDDRHDLPPFDAAQTVALYMGVASFPVIADRLRRAGYPPSLPIAIIEKGTTDAQRVVRSQVSALASVAKTLRIESPALLVIGETARYAERYGWFGSRPLEVVAADEEDRPSVATAG